MPRFCNWMANGQPIGAEGNGTTETGSYTLSGAVSQSALMAIMRNPGATWVIPSEDEWYKAAYYDPDANGGAGGYWDYATRTDALPSIVFGNPDAGARVTDPGNHITGRIGGSGSGWTNPNNVTLPIPPLRTVVGEWENSASALRNL